MRKNSSLVEVTPRNRDLQKPKSKIVRECMSKWHKWVFPVKVHKHLMNSEEKAHILGAIKKNPTRCVESFSREFKRLPATIVKIAAEAGIELAHGR